MPKNKIVNKTIDLQATTKPTIKLINIKILNRTKTLPINQTINEINTTIINQTNQLLNETNLVQAIKQNKINSNMNKANLIINDKENLFKNLQLTTELLNINNNNKIKTIKNINLYNNNNNNINTKNTQLSINQYPKINYYSIGHKKYIIKSIPIEQYYQQQTQFNNQLLQQQQKIEQLQSAKLFQVIFKFYFNYFI